MATFFKVRGALSTISYFLKPKVDLVQVPNRGGPKLNIPKKKHPPWLPKQFRVVHREEVTKENTQFIQEVIESKYGPRDIGLGMTTQASPLKVQPIEPQGQWTEKSRRTGVIVKKIGIYPMWLKNGKKVSATLLQVADNHVIKYIPPEDFKPMVSGRYRRPKNKLGSLVIGAESTDPQRVGNIWHNMTYAALSLLKIDAFLECTTNYKLRM